MSLQPLENKALSRGIIGKSASLLAEITIRKSQVFKQPVDGETSPPYGPAVVPRITLIGDTTVSATLL
jgi:hypothetical protein